jgi:ubiquinone/menaquinone biosynthesis C-methylase UbiE
MVAAELGLELSRRIHVRGGVLRAAAVRIAYLAYSRALLRWEDRSSSDAAASLKRRLEQLFDEDWQDAHDGLTAGEALPWGEYARALPRLLADLPRTRSRIANEEVNDLPEDAARYPEYYARNFHFQSEGYLGHNSALLYDLQVELLFGGTGDVMRRRLVPPVVRFTQQQPQQQGAPLRVLDVACGTGHLLRMLGAALPKGTKLFGLDLSPHYISRAREMLPRDLDVSLVCDNAEKLPFVDASFDAVTNVFLLHEVPTDVRTRVLSEMARVLRPGGLLVVADSLQLADAPELRKELLAFPVRFHEPYYKSYLSEDLAERVEKAGLRVTAARPAFLTKVVTAEKAP